MNAPQIAGLGCAFILGLAPSLPASEVELLRLHVLICGEVTTRIRRPPNMR
jgi:hypothetical protein